MTRGSQMSKCILPSPLLIALANPSPQVVCEVGNPLPAGAEIRLELVFQPSPNTNATSLGFVFVTSSASEEEDTEDNEMVIALPVTMRSVVVIQG